MKIFDRFKKVMGLGATTPITQPSTLTAPIAYANTSYLTPPLPTDDPNNKIVSLPQGFPLEMAQLISSGGTPVDMGQTNGLFNYLSQFIVWINTGGQWTFDPAVVTANGGYNKGQILWCASVQRYLLSLVNNNTANFLTNPNYINDGVNWVFAEMPSIADDLKGNITVKGNLTGQQGNFIGLLSALGGLAITGLGTLNNKNIATTDMIPTYPDITDSGGLVSITGSKGLKVNNGITTSTNTYPATGRPAINDSFAATQADVAALFNAPSSNNVTINYPSGRKFIIQTGTGLTNSAGQWQFNYPVTLTTVLASIPVLLNGLRTSEFIQMCAQSASSSTAYVQGEGSEPTGGIQVQITVLGYV